MIFSRAIDETLVFTAQQNIAHRGFDENRRNSLHSFNTSLGNFLELMHLRNRDIAWLAAKLQTQSELHRQWLSPDVENELF